ncbi:DUF4943 family protein [Bacteroides propionicifaciens]|jgi:hypothetical protein|uniref:DUF4943 family protein n=1 Tax=Bacteroides propionicifaciens TaxID=392838 RepID=UPI0003819923|nr:DUF4943 family protein [Bacteroides propionicifaciens]
MKRLAYIFSLFVLLFTLGSCGTSTLDYDHPDVDIFVRQLKAGTYETKSPEGFIEVPNFIYKDVPKLLSYSTDLTIIPTFPLPPIASSIAGEIKLGECMLWIVETIRMGDYASLGCHMVRVNADNYEPRYFLSDEEILDAAVHYKRWWENRLYPKTRWSVDPCFDNPLCGTGYQWW